MILAVFLQCMQESTTAKKHNNHNNHKEELNIQIMFHQYKYRG